MDRLSLPPAGRRAPASRQALAGQRVLVTGVTGFIGSHLVQRLLAAGAAVRALVLPGEALPAGWPGRVDIAWCSVTDPAGAAAAYVGGV